MRSLFFGPFPCVCLCGIPSRRWPPVQFGQFAAQARGGGSRSRSRAAEEGRLAGVGLGVRASMGSESRGVGPLDPETDEETEAFPRPEPAFLNRCFLVTTGAQKPPVRVSKQPVGGSWDMECHLKGACFSREVRTSGANTKSLWQKSLVDREGQYKAST